MIVAEADDRVRFITQPDHAALAGQFADAWGNDRFARPSPRPPVLLAAHAHDDGWWRFDRRPRLHDDGTPIDFYELEAGPWTDLYERGIESVADLDPYAGLLVSMHGAGLRRRRYGLSPSWPDTPAPFEGFVTRQEARHWELFEALAGTDRVNDTDETLLETIHETGTPPADTDSRLWGNYARLQAWDTLSLAFCTSVDPPSDQEIASVPTEPAGPDRTLRIEAAGDGAVVVSPWPFTPPAFNVSVPARTVHRSAIGDESELLDAYYAAGLDTLTFHLRRPDGT